jgi:nitrate/nitrite transport system substrate-binding protein
MIKIGFIALTDCASVVMAEKLGLYKKYGVDVTITKEASWAVIRDKLLTGELDAAHCLFGMPFSVYTGVGGKAGSELKIAMMLNQNGQGITLDKRLIGAGYGNSAGVKPAVDALRRTETPTFAMTFPGGTHDMWLRYWMAASKISQKSVKIITIPPPQMVANMKVGNMDGYCVGEPWNGVAVKQDVGFTHLASQDLWKNHPEKALVVNSAFASSQRAELKNVMKAILEASVWLDNIPNRRSAASTIGGPAFVNAPADVIDKRLEGVYELGGGLPNRTFKGDYMIFHNKGNVNFPRKAHAIWFMTQYVRFGLIPSLPDVNSIASKLILTDLYKEVAKEMKVGVPNDDMSAFTIKLDNVKFDPKKPADYLKAHPI